VRRAPDRVPSRFALTLAVALAVLSTGAGCNRCGSKPSAGAPAERYVPAGASGAILIPELGELQRQAAALYGTLLAMPGGGDLSALRTGLGAQLGFDPFDPASLEAVGVDPRRGAAMAELSARPGEELGQPLLVLPVSDEGRLRGWVARLARDRLGAAEEGKENANGRPFDVWRRAPGEPSLLAMAVVDGTALLAAGPRGPDAVRAALGLDPALSLEKSPGWQRVRAALGNPLPVEFYLPAGAAVLQRGVTPDGAVLGASATARTLTVTMAGLTGAKDSLVRPLVAGAPAAPGPSALDPDTVLVVRLSASPQAALDLALQGAPEAPAVTDLRALAALLEPGIDLGLSLSPRAELGAALASRGASIDPLRVARLELVATVKDPAVAAPVFDRVAKELRGEARAGRWRVGGPRAELAWTLRGRTLALAGGPSGGLDALVARLAVGSGPVAGARAPGAGPAEAPSGNLGGAALSGDALVKGLKGLPTEAWGTGPDAVVARSLVEKLAAPAGGGGGVTLRADLPPGALRLALTLTLGQPPKAP